MSKHFVEVEIAGRPYKIRSDSESEELQQIAAHVDRTMRRVQSQTGTPDTLDVAMLTCLNLARDLLGWRRRALEEAPAASAAGVGPDETRLRELIERVEEVMAPGPEASAPKPEDGPEAAKRAEPPAPDAVRTLDLSSALRDSAAVSSESSKSSEANGPATDAAPPAPRVAAGGRRERGS